MLGNAPLTTRERIRRDRELHRLGLNLVERIPKDVLIDLVQVCKTCSSSLKICVFYNCYASNFLLACSVESASVCNASGGGTCWVLATQSIQSRSLVTGHVFGL